MQVEQIQNAGELREPETVRSMGWMTLLVFVLWELYFARMVFRIYQRHTLMEYLSGVILFQLSLANLWGCFWRLWTGNVIHQYRGQHWNHTRLYVCLACLSAFLMVIVEPKLAAAAAQLTH